MGRQHVSTTDQIRWLAIFEEQATTYCFSFKMIEQAWITMLRACLSLVQGRLTFVWQNMDDVSIKYMCTVEVGNTSMLFKRYTPQGQEERVPQAWQVHKQVCVYLRMKQRSLSGVG